MSEPLLQALLVSEGNVLDVRSTRFSVFNIFNTIVCPQFPTYMPSLAIYAKVEDISGSYTGKFQILDPDFVLIYDGPEGRGVARADETTEYGGRVAALPINKPGVYCVQFVCNGKVLGTTKVVAAPERALEG